MIIETVKFLAEYYGKDLSVSQISAYIIGLDDISERALEAASKDIIRAATFMPRVAEIRKATEPYRGLSDVDHLMVAFVAQSEPERWDDLDGWSALSEQFKRADRPAMADACRLRACVEKIDRRIEYALWGGKDESTQ
jgi:hypothetical protein